MPGFDFTPNYVENLPGYDDYRVHYLDEGPPAANDVFLCLHGQPTWCYLYRKMIPVFTGAGHRVVAPDLIGFGRSDKSTDDDQYTFHFHRNMLIAFIEALDLRNITLVCQDWGGILGLTIVPGMPERFGRLIVMNTAIPIGEDLGQGFADWRAFNRSKSNLDIGGLMQRSCPNLTQAEALAYDAPFPDASYKAGVRRFPELVMTNPEMPGVEEGRLAVTWWKHDWHGETLMAVGAKDPVLGVPTMREITQDHSKLSRSPDH